MINEPRRILVLGATSTLAIEYMKLRASAFHDLYLVARDGERLAAVAADLETLGGRVEVAPPTDLNDASTIDQTLQRMTATLGVVEEVFIAQSVYMPEPVAPDDVTTIATTNFVGPAQWAIRCAETMAGADGGRVVLVSSVTGDRPRSKNATYGASKAALAAFGEALGQSVRKSGVKVCVIKPGWMRTEMSAGRDTGSILYTDADRAAQIIARVVDSDKRVAYVPWFWRPIAALVNLMPSWLLVRLGL